MKTIVGALFVFFFVSCTFASTGVDVSDAVGQDEFSCMYNQSYTFAIVRVPSTKLELTFSSASDQRETLTQIALPTLLMR